MEGLYFLFPLRAEFFMDAVIFDLDGVVVDTERYWNRAEEDIYREITGEDVDVDELAGMSITNTYEKLSERYNLSVSRDEFFNMYKNHAENVYCEKAELMDGVKDLIGEIRDRGLKIGLATGSYWPNYVIDRFDLEFDAVVHSGNIEGKGKPEPETYLKAVEELDIRPEAAVAVDDTGAGIESASGAGLYCIGYTGSGGEGPEGADETVEGAEELRARLLELAEQ